MEHLLRARFLLWVLEEELHVVRLGPCPVQEKSNTHEPEVKNQQIKCKVVLEPGSRTEKLALSWRMESFMEEVTFELCLQG